MMDKVKIIILGLVAVVLVAGVLRFIDNLFRDEIDPSGRKSKVVSDAVSGNVETEVEVNRDGVVKVRTNEVELTAKRDIKQGERFKVDLGVHTVSAPVQYSDVTTWFGASTNGLGFGLSLNNPLAFGSTFGLFLGVNGIRSGYDYSPLIMGVNLGYYWDINKHGFIGYDFIGNAGVLGIGVRW